MSNGERYVVQRRHKRVDILDTHTHEFAISYFGSYWSERLDEAERHATRTCTELNQKDNGRP